MSVNRLPGPGVVPDDGSGHVEGGGWSQGSQNVGRGAAGWVSIATTGVAGSLAKAVIAASGL